MMHFFYFVFYLSSPSQESNTAESTLALAGSAYFSRPPPSYSYLKKKLRREGFTAYSLNLIKASAFMQRKVGTPLMSRELGKYRF